MKTNHLQSIKLTIATVAVMAAVAWSANSVIAAETGSAKGGAALLMQDRSVMTAKAAVAATEGNGAVVPCPKCITETVKRVTLEKGHIPQTTWVQRHECPGCSSKFEVTGHGKMKTAGFTHVCTEQGSGSASCCAVKPHAGMAKK